MAKVNEFETAHYQYGTSKQRFSDEANIQYTFPDAEELLNDPKQIEKFIKHHQQHQRPRLDTLDDYYEGNNSGILVGKRRREEHLSDHRAVHNFAKYVTQFIQGYLTGIPLKTVYPVDKIDEKLKDMNRLNDADAHNSDLVLDLSIYGRAYELLYRNNRHENRFTLSSPLESFVIYDDTVEAEPIAGIRYIRNSLKEDVANVYVYTEKKIVEYAMANDGSLSFVKEGPNYFDGVPIIEYSNNRFRQGDFEDVLSLIDLYDSAQSDIANYMSDLNDATLVISGNMDIDTEKAKKQKEANLLLLQPDLDGDGKANPVKAEYIYKKYDVSGTEAYKDRLQNDIHKFTNTPNMNDEKFAGAQSGESMKYKLFGLEQKRSIKERLFKRSLRQRYRLLNNIMTTASEGGFDVNDIVITFTPNLPKSVKDEIAMFRELGGELSDETKLSLLSIVDNPQEEMERIAAEQPERSVYDFEEKQVRE